MSTSVLNDKREKGQYYTLGNPFQLLPFRIWAEMCDLSNKTVLEPFAGNGSIPKLLENNEFRPKSWQMFDIDPQDKNIQKRDTLSFFPKNYDVCITNPPWLSRNSATRKNLIFPKICDYNDLYKFSLQQCLIHCQWVAAIVPESYIRTNMFFDRLSDFVSLLSDTGTMFDDTEHPVGLALFTPNYNNRIRIWRDKTPLGTYKGLQQYLPNISTNKNIRFNDPDGNLGLIAIDDTKKASIRFCTASEIPDNYVTYKRRSKTRIRLDYEPNIDAYNYMLNLIRANTHDVFMTAFKGVRKDGLYRRRLDWKLARSIIDSINLKQTTLEI